MPRTPDPVTCGHPDRPHRSLGMCAPCYWVHWRRLTKERRESEKARIARRLDELARMTS